MVGISSVFVRENGQELLMRDGEVHEGESFEPGIVRRIAGRPLSLLALQERRDGAARGLVATAGEPRPDRNPTAGDRAETDRG
jgi:hypothetical protein